MEKDLKQIFSVLRNGGQEEIKVAKKQLEMLWRKDRKKIEKAALFILQEINEFDKIQSYKNQEAFISGLNLFFLILADTHFNELKHFVIKVICHPNGHIREQMRKTADWLYVSLSSRIRPFSSYQGKKLTQKQVEEQERAKEEFIEYLSDIGQLLIKYDDENNASIEFIENLKPSVYKSLQILWADLTRGSLQNYLHTPSIEILDRREKIEKELLTYIRRSKNRISVEDIKEIIYEETNTDELNNLIQVFHTRSLSDMQIIVTLLNEAWNYFPHRVLGALSPIEMISKKSQKTRLPN